MEKVFLSYIDVLQVAPLLSSFWGNDPFTNGTYCHLRGSTRWRSWLRHCATSRKVAGSIPDDVIGIFH